MADWYVSSVSWTALTQWAATTTYAVGNIRRGLVAPAVTAQHVFRVSAITTGISGGSEPAWNVTNNATTTDSGVTWTCVTGQSTYNWTAPAGNFQTLAARFGASDRCFLSSDHAQTQASSLSLTPSTAAIQTPMLVMSVNKAGSVPPVAADYLTGASCATTAGGILTIEGNARWRGITFDSAASIRINSGSELPSYLRDCVLFLNNATGSSRIATNGGAANWTWQDTTVKFGSTAQSIALTSSAASQTLDWFGSGSGVAGATLPTNLFTSSLGSGVVCTVRGVDFSNLGSGNNLVSLNPTSCPGSRYTFTNCKLGTSATIAVQSQLSGQGIVVEAINCDTANTNYRCERYCSPQGAITTETTITLTGGASDGTTTVSRKMVTTANMSEFVLPLEGFPMDVWNTATGVSKTATTEIISSGTLTNADISLQLEYLGDASSCLGSLADNFIATELTTPANVTSSSASWNASPATPVKQKLQVTFTPQKAGIVRGIVSLRKASTTVYVDPVMAIA